MRAALALLVSLGLHAGMAVLAILLARTAPAPEDQSRGDTDMRVTTTAVSATQAEAQGTEGARAAAEGADQGQALQQGVVRESRASAATPAADALETSVAAGTEVAPAALPSTATVAPVASVAPTVSGAPLRGSSVASVSEEATRVTALAAAPSSTAPAVAAATPALETQAIPSQALAASASVGARIAATQGAAAAAVSTPLPTAAAILAPTEESQALADAALNAAALPAATLPDAPTPAVTLALATTLPLSGPVALRQDAAVEVAQPSSGSVASRPASAFRVEPAAPAGQAVTVDRPDAPATQAVVARADAAAPAAPPSDIAPALPSAGTAAAESAPREDVVASAAPQSDGELSAAELPALAGRASLAWSGGGQGTVDPVSLAAVEAFMAPSDARGARTAREDIGDVLARVPCSRLRAEFDPDAGALRLRGHVPEDVIRGTLTTALSTHLGADIPVVDELRILPRPQCEIFDGIDEVGLPQSSEHLTNRRMVGPEGYARIYDLKDGDELMLDIGGADYGATLYVDYFDAAGDVLHLAPNDAVEPIFLEEEDTVRIGGAGFPLRMIVSPPYDREIVVVFAASSPLSDTLRPIREPAEEYLAWLQAQVARAREENPTFKGEWSYFFVSTGPR